MRTYRKHTTATSNAVAGTFSRDSHAALVLCRSSTVGRGGARSERGLATTSARWVLKGDFKWS